MLIPNRAEIKKRRLDMSLSQRALCKKAGLPNNSINRVENSESSFIYPIRAKAIAEALDCEILDVFKEVKRT